MSNLALRFAFSLAALITLASVVEGQPTSSWSLAEPVVNKWIQRYRDSGRTVSARNEIASEIHQLLNEHASEIWAYEAAAVGFNNLNLNREAVEVMRTYLRRFDGNQTLIDRVWFFFMNWGVIDDMSAVPESWHDRPEYWRAVLQIDVRSKAAPDVLETAGLQLLARIPSAKDSGGNERIRIAEMWLKHGVNPQVAERVAREAVAIAEVGDLPQFTPSTSAQTAILRQLLVINVNRSTLGWALYHQGRFREALIQMKQAVAICDKNDVQSPKVFYRLGRTLEKMKRPREALEAYFKNLSWDGEDSETKGAITNLYQRVYGTTRGLDALQRTRVNALLSAQAVPTNLVRVVNQELGRFQPTDSQGQPFNVQQYLGKVVIVEFWATWCGICRATMKQTDSLERQSPDDIVVVGWSDDPEETQPAAAQFLRTMQYNFTLVFGDKSQRELEIPFIPARLIIDRSGHLRVMEFGYKPASAREFELQLRVILGEKAAKQKAPSR